MIEAGQVYASCDPRDSGRKILIMRYSPGALRADIVGHPDGKRFRRILASTLHDSLTTGAGQPRRTGYHLVGRTDAAPGN